MNAQFAPIRTASNTIVLYLSPNHPAPPCPPEINDEVTQDAWTHRLNSVTEIAARYNKPILERIWITLALLSILIVPVTVFPVILRALHFRDDSVSHVFEARSISMVIFVALLLLFFVPMAIWKYIGQKQVNMLLTKWRNLEQGRVTSVWVVKTPGIFRSSIILNIHLPPGKAATAFTFNAYLDPSFINAPIDAGANHYYADAQRMDAVPLYDEKAQLYGREKV